jgi:type IV pilus assembly protein PilY1
VPKSGEQRCNSSVNIILMTDGDPTLDTDADNSIYSEHQELYSESVPVIRNNYMPALAEVMHGRDGSDPVTVDLYPGSSNLKDTAYIYTIGFGQGMSDAGKDILTKTAELGGGKYYQPDSAGKLKDDFNKIISDINQRNSSFVSPSVSMNSSDQTQSGNALYYTMFLPEKHTRWRGNLK